MASSSLSIQERQKYIFSVKISHSVCEWLGLILAFIHFLKIVNEFSWNIGAHITWLSCLQMNIWCPHGTRAFLMKYCVEYRIISSMHCTNYVRVNAAIGRVFPCKSMFVLLYTWLFWSINELVEKCEVKGTECSFEISWLLTETGWSNRQINI